MESNLFWNEPCFRCKKISESSICPGSGASGSDWVRGYPCRLLIEDTEEVHPGWLMAKGYKEPIINNGVELRWILLCKKL